MGGAEKVADKFACFRRDFMSAPIRKAFKALLEKKSKDLAPC